MQTAIGQQANIFAEESLLRPRASPWVSDQVLLNLAVWWVKSTNPGTLDFSSEVAVVFSSLERDLR